MSTRPRTAEPHEDPDATAELPAVNFVPAPEEVSDATSSTDVFPVPAIAVGAAELGDRLREVEHRLHRKAERLRQLEAELGEAVERQALLEARLAQSQAQQAALEAQLEAARAYAQQQTQLAADSRAAADRHHEHDHAELRRCSERQLEALGTWQGFRAVSDALLAESEARSAQLESQIASLGESLRLRESGPVVAARSVEPVAPEVAPQDPGDTGEEPVARMPYAAAPLRLLIREGGNGDVVYPLGRRTSVGRTPDNDIQIDAANISRHHAVLLSSAEHCIVEDLNSTNGVLINGRRVVRQILQDGDIVTVGKTVFRFQQHS